MEQEAKKGMKARGLSQRVIGAGKASSGYEGSLVQVAA